VQICVWLKLRTSNKSPIPIIKNLSLSRFFVFWQYSEVTETFKSCFVQPNEVMYAKACLDTNFAKSESLVANSI